MNNINGFTPEANELLQKLVLNMEKQRLNILMLRFYSYMESQGYPKFWETCDGIVTPTKKWNKDRTDRTPKWHFRFKDGTECLIPLDDDNKIYMELYKERLNALK